jgi:glycerol uptake facilitator-like aquaporin
MFINIVVRTKLNTAQALYCVGSQVVGAFVAASIAFAIYNNDFGSLGFPHSNAANRHGEAFLAEAIQTFALATTVLNTATTKIQANNSYFGLAIGSVVLSGALVVGPISGGSFNPAVSMLTAFQGDWNDIWPIIVGPFLGGLCAGLVFRVTNPAEWDDTDPLARLTSSHHNPNGNLTRLAAMLTQEFIGTFFWAWTYALEANADPSVGLFGVGFILIAMSYAGGAVSG